MLKKEKKKRKEKRWKAGVGTQSELPPSDSDTLLRLEPWSPPHLAGCPDAPFNLILPLDNVNEKRGRCLMG